MEKVKNIPELIGKLILNGYNVDIGRCTVIGNEYDYDSITLRKRFAYYDDDKILQGYDEYIDIDCISGDIDIKRKSVERYRAY